ncbi:MAG: alpha/beta hydrolase [Chlamydiales bacterium]|nr:alpha/beta hydrolase [Chlamydiia bacterium]MCP5508091.1 alpha/beta hydrolase [Chlamydiales bacterium]
MRRWVLVRGVGHEAGHWLDFPSLLQRAFPEDRFHFIDIPGSGKFFKKKVSIKLEELAEHVRSEALQQDPPPFTILSLSLGGMLAYEWADKHPEEIEAMVLINTSFSPFSPALKRFRWQIVPKFVWSLFQRRAESREAMFLDISSNKIEGRKKIVIHRVAIRKKHPVTVSTILRHLFAAKFYPGGSTPPKVPTLILSSIADRLCDPSCSRNIEKAWRVPHHIHPWAGHDLTLDDPEWAIEQIKSWIVSLDE